MKRLLYLAILCAVTVVPMQVASAETTAESQGITVTSPTSGEVWKVGTTHTIDWYDETGSSMARNVNITLEPYIPCLYTTPACYVVQIAPYTIATNIASTGSLSWTVPLDISTRYQTSVRITVAATDGSIRGTSGVFAIGNTSSNLVLSPGVLKGVVGQKISSNFSVYGGVAPYSWSVVSGSLPEGLYLTFPAFNCITTPCIDPKDQAYISGVPTKPGSFNFTLRITDSTGQAVEQSFAFGITDGTLSRDVLTILSPVEGTTWTAGNSYIVSWTPTQPGTTVTIELWRYFSCLHSTTYVCALAQPAPLRITANAPDTGNFSWVISESLESRFYGESTIRVTNNSTGTSGESKVFTMTGGGSPLTPGMVVIAPGSGTVFYILPGPYKYGFTSYEDFSSRGFSFSQVQKVDKSSLDTIPQVASMPRRVGSSFKYSGKPAIYYLTSDCKQVYPSMATLSAWNVGISQVATISETEQYPDCSKNFVQLPENTAVRLENTRTVFVIRSGIRYPFANYEAFLRQGFGGKRVLVIPQYELELYPLGDAITQ